MAKYVIRCTACGTTHHGKMSDDCPYCGARGKGERLKVNAIPMHKLLKIEY